MTARVHARRLLKQPKIIFAIVIAIVISIIMTIISLKLYDMDYVSRLDVSTPDRQDIRSKAASDTSDSNDDASSFAASGSLDKQSFSTFQGIYSKNRTALDALGKFDDDALSDDNLQLSGNSQTTNQ